MKAFNYDKIPEFFLIIFPALKITLEYVFLAFLIGIVLGTLLAFAKISKNKFIKKLAYGYTTVMRCTPSIVLLFIVYYGLPKFINSLFGIQMDTLNRTKYVTITLALFCISSLSEVIRAAYESLDKTQIEASASIGMTKMQSFFHVLLPQMFSAAIPNFCNTILMLIKEGALAYTIGLLDLFGKGNYVIGQHHGGYAVEVYAILIIIYWLLSLFITSLSHYFENAFDYSSGGRNKRRRKNA
ncbi:amino acid ABC transporter permease [Kineothrix sedimenti]|uniref:Amino acid ABC transporter permease n=1 Tax=Kineothrix sedimenti TaxID=3123317 RepID=A0ABZ3ETG4_9FIRM